MVLLPRIWAFVTRATDSRKSLLHHARSSPLLSSWPNPPKQLNRRQRRCGRSRRPNGRPLGGDDDDQKSTKSETSPILQLFHVNVNLRQFICLLSFQTFATMSFLHSSALIDHFSQGNQGNTVQFSRWFVCFNYFLRGKQEKHGLMHAMIFAFTFLRAAGF